MREADLAFRHRVNARGDGGKLFADCDSISRCAACHMAVEADPGDGGGRALSVVLVRGGKCCSRLRELEPQPIALIPEVDELAGEGLRRAAGLPALPKPVARLRTERPC